MTTTATAATPARLLVALAILAILALVALAARRPHGVEGYDEADADDATRTDDEDELWLEARLAEMHAHLKHVDPDLEASVRAVRDVRILRDPKVRQLPDGRVSFSSGKFKHSTGVLWVGSLDGYGRRRGRPDMLMTLLHEMAHATRGPTDLTRDIAHNDAWNDVWRRLLAHATQHLGWVVQVGCAECTYYNLCDTSQCPKCRWKRPRAGQAGQQAATCPPYQGGSPSDFRKRKKFMANRRGRREEESHGARAQNP